MFVTLAGVTAVSVLLAFVTGARLIEAFAGIACLVLAAFTYLLLQRQAQASRRRYPGAVPVARDDAWF